MILHAGPVGQAVMVTLLIFSLVSWAIIFMKFRLFRNIKKETNEFLEAFWSSANLSEAFKITEDYPYSPEATVFSSGFEELQKINKLRSRPDEGSIQKPLGAQLAAMDNLKRALRKAESQEISHMGRLLPFLATTGSATPFIGLFGTVWGIMVSFHDIGMRGSASLAVVAPGISEALVATAAGLAAAIPAVIFFNYFSNVVVEIDNEIQNFSTDFLNLVERDLICRV